MKRNPKESIEFARPLAHVVSNPVLAPLWSLWVIMGYSTYGLLWVIWRANLTTALLHPRGPIKPNKNQADIVVIWVVRFRLERGAKMGQVGAKIHYFVNFGVKPFLPRFGVRCWSFSPAPAIYVLPPPNQKMSEK